MTVSNPHIELGKRVIAFFFIALMFFVYAVEALHYHPKTEYDTSTKHSIVVYTPQCLICDQLHHQNHDGLTPSNPFEVDEAVFIFFLNQTFYLPPSYTFTLSTISNKDPPIAFMA